MLVPAKQCLMKHNPSTQKGTCHEESQCVNFCDVTLRTGRKHSYKTYRPLDISPLRNHIKKKKNKSNYTIQASSSDSHLLEKHIEKKMGCLGQRLDKREKKIKRFLLIHQRVLGAGIYEESPGSEAQHGNTP